jgi:gas vesicle protein
MGDSNSDFSAFLAGFVIGGLVGAATALLMAPQSGEETRTIIREKSIELKDKAGETAAETRALAEKAYADAAAKAEASLKEAQARYDELALQAKSKTDELKQRGQVVLDEQKAKLEEQKSKVEEAIAARKKPADEVPVDTGDAPAEA